MVLANIRPAQRRNPATQWRPINKIRFVSLILKEEVNVVCLFFFVNFPSSTCLLFCWKRQLMWRWLFVVIGDCWRMAMVRRGCMRDDADSPSIRPIFTFWCEFAFGFFFLIYLYYMEKAFLVFFFATYYIVTQVPIYLFKIIFFLFSFIVFMYL